MGSHQFLQKNRRQGGYTLVELAIAVAILAVLIVSGLTGVQSILTSGKVNEQIKTVAKLGSKVSANYSSLSTSGVTLATVANLGGWDTSKVSTTSGGVTSVRSAFNSGEFITTNAAAVSGMAANAGFLYTRLAPPIAQQASTPSPPGLSTASSCGATAVCSQVLPPRLVRPPCNSKA